MCQETRNSFNTALSLVVRYKQVIQRDRLPLLYINFFFISVSALNTFRLLEASLSWLNSPFAIQQIKGKVIPLQARCVPEGG